MTSAHNRAGANAVSVDFGKAERRRSSYTAGDLIAQFVELFKISRINRVFIKSYPSSNMVFCSIIGMVIARANFF